MKCCRFLSSILCAWLISDEIEFRLECNVMNISVPNVEPVVVLFLMYTRIKLINYQTQCFYSTESVIVRQLPKTKIIGILDFKTANNVNNWPSKFGH